MKQAVIVSVIACTPVGRAAKGAFNAIKSLCVDGGMDAAGLFEVLA